MFNRRILVVAAILTVIVVGIFLVTQEQQPSEIPQPSISYLDILENPEFEQGIQQAIQNNDQALFDALQAKAVEIAEAAQLPEEQRALIEGERGAHHIRFRAKRQLFWQEVERRYRELKGIEDLYAKYPEAESLFDQADELMAKREAMLNELADALQTENSSLNRNEAMQQAQVLWLQRFDEEG